MFLSTWLALWMMMGGPVQRPSVRFQRHGSSVALRMKYVSDPAVKFLPPREFPALTHPCHLMRTQSQSAPGGWPSRQRTGVAAQLFSDALVTGGNGMNEAGRRKLQHVSFHIRACMMARWNPMDRGATIRMRLHPTYQSPS
jgi:hypothetical protein